MFGIKCLIGKHDWEPITKDVVLSGEVIDDLTNVYRDKHNNLPPKVRELMDIDLVINAIFGNTYRGNEFDNCICLGCGKKGNPERDIYTKRIKRIGDRMYKMNLIAAERKAKANSIMEIKKRSDIAS